ncbi:hypothetical protein [Rubrolithibacter danxiaensis]|uniref:hypothetical protein n=1 Tax=Rubrolithibacter danxiaensis TaxID=3390805 RepID=UPI003BF7EB30
MSWLSTYEWLSFCSGIELNIQGENQYKAKVCSVSVNKSALHIDDKAELEGDLKTIFKKVQGKEAIAVTLTGKGILIKKTDRIEVISQETLSKVFPNLVIENFYIQNFISGDHSFLSIIRKELVDVIFEEALKVGLKVLVISLGPFVVSQVLNQFNNYNDQFIFDGHRINYDTQYQWLEYSYNPDLRSPFPLKIDVETIPETFVLSYATAFQLALFNRLLPVSVESDVTVSALTEFKEEKKFKMRLTGILGAFFFLLLMNFLIFSIYSNKNEELISRVNQSSASIETLKGIEEDIEIKEVQLQDLGWKKGIKYAFLSDQIAQTTPSAVNLVQLAINPVNTVKTTSERREVIDMGSIEIRGRTDNMQAVNNWIYMLKEKKWAQEVLLTSFSPSTDSDQEALSQEFTIKIKY